MVSLRPDAGENHTTVISVRRESEKKEYLLLFCRATVAVVKISSTSVTMEKQYQY